VLKIFTKGSEAFGSLYPVGMNYKSVTWMRLTKTRQPVHHSPTACVKLTQSCPTDLYFGRYERDFSIELWLMMKRECVTKLRVKKTVASIIRQPKCSNSSYHRGRLWNLSFITGKGSCYWLILCPKGPSRCILWEPYEVEKEIKRREMQTYNCVVTNDNTDPILASFLWACSIHLDGILWLTHPTFKTWHYQIIIFFISLNWKFFFAETDF